MSKEHPEMQLMDAVRLVSHISCSKCDADGEDEVFDDNEAIEGFYAEGWRATERHTYCPKCAKKYLKRKKK